MATVNRPVIAEVRQIGESLGLILPDEVLARLNVADGDKLFLVEVTGGYLLSPRDPEFHEQATVAQDVMKQDQDILRDLAN